MYIRMYLHLLGIESTALFCVHFIFMASMGEYLVILPFLGLPPDSSTPSNVSDQVLQGNISYIPLFL